MPVAHGPQINARSAVLVGLTGVVIGLLLLGMVLWVADSGNSVTINLGDTVFDAGFVEAQADEIADRGPILYADAGSSGDRDLFIQHIGDDPEVGWLAFSARRLGDPRDCSVRWVASERIFVLESSNDTTCDAVEFDELGCGLVRYPAEVIDGKVTVFLNEDFDEVEAALDDERPPGPDLGCPPG